uniref:Variant surface glycoprotein 1125.4090 n=1 Tax=Trypanosoma brucei TaxID=5691 RepID=A0A1J0R9Z2_9TRYP|nr:variant surface glycoprotein 1125.4090 [Trypanosoma brucei]
MYAGLVILAFLIPKTSSSDTTLANDATTWCHERQYVALAVEAINVEASQRAERFEKNQKIAAAWTLGAAGLQLPGRKNVYELLSYVAAQIQTSAATNLKNFLEQARPISQYFSNRLKIYDKAIAVQAASKSTLGNGAGTGAVHSTACTVAVTLKIGDENLCSNGQLPGKTAAATLDELKTATKVKIAATLEAADLLTATPWKLTAGGDPGSHTWSNGAAAGTCNCGTGCGQTSMKLTRGGQYTAKDRTLTGQSLPNDDQAAPGPEEDTTKESEHTQSKALAMYQKLKSLLNSPANLLNLAGLTATQAQQAIQQNNLGQAVLNFNNKLNGTTLQETNKNIEDKIKEILGDAASFTAVYTSKTLNAKVSMPWLNGGSDTTFDAIITQGKAAQLLGHLKGVELQSQAATDSTKGQQQTRKDVSNKQPDEPSKNQTTAPSEFERACGVIPAADKCKDPCNWTDDKCKLKEGVVPTGSICVLYSEAETCVKAPGTPAPGKKSVCSWIEDKCQDSSFLVNRNWL